MPIEHLTPAGMTPAFAAAVVDHRGWTAARIACFDAGFARYWVRGHALARRDPTWPPPRLRHVMVVDDPLAVHPYAALLNTSAWTLSAGDLDPARSDPELVAWLLACGDHLQVCGDVALAALHATAWWFERSDAECAAFVAAAQVSARPDGDALRAVADALPWLRRLGHARLRPCRGPHHALRDTALQVPVALADRPPDLIRRQIAAAHGTLERYRARWQGTDAGAAAALRHWLVEDAPPLLITAGDGAVVWDPDAPAAILPLTRALAGRSGVALRELHADLAVVAAHTRRVQAALAGHTLSEPGDVEQQGYVYMHRTRGLLACNLDEPGIDRRLGPALPFARAMLGARAVHEWAHRAVDAGLVPPAVAPAELARRRAHLAALLAEMVAAAPPAIAAATQADLAALCAAAQAPAGEALADLVLRRLPDFQANVFAQRFLDPVERETYVRHNIRTLRGSYPPARRWRMLVRYLFEYQYLRFSAVADRHAFFVHSTWFDADFYATGLLDEARFAALTAAVAAICDAYAVNS